MRAPMMPNGTAHTAMSSEAHGATPRRRSRYSMIRTAATMPRTMHSAYARTGRPSTCHTDVVGLGIAARVTGAPYRRSARMQSKGLGRAYAGGQIGTQRAQALLTGPRVGRVEHAADQRAADDHAVRERRHLGRLSAVADPEAHAHRQFRVDRADPGD